MGAIRLAMVADMEEIGAAMAMEDMGEIRAAMVVMGAMGMEDMAVARVVMVVAMGTRVATAMAKAGGMEGVDMRTDMRTDTDLRRVSGEAMRKQVLGTATCSLATTRTLPMMNMKRMTT